MKREELIKLVKDFFSEHKITLEIYTDYDDEENYCGESCYLSAGNAFVEISEFQ